MGSSPLFCIKRSASWFWTFNLYYFSQVSYCDDVVTAIVSNPSILSNGEVQITGVTPGCSIFFDSADEQFGSSDVILISKDGDHISKQLFKFELFEVN